MIAAKLRGRSSDPPGRRVHRRSRWSRRTSPTRPGRGSSWRSPSPTGEHPAPTALLDPPGLAARRLGRHARGGLRRRGSGDERGSPRPSRTTLLDVVGPLGRGFQLPRAAFLPAGGRRLRRRPPVLPGRGAAPRDKAVNMIIGARDHERVFKPVEGKRLVRPIVSPPRTAAWASGAGSRTSCAGDRAHRAEVVYACGPNPMLRAVAEACHPARPPVPGGGRGADGVRARRVLDLRGAAVAQDGRGWWNVRACVEGPVFNGAVCGGTGG